MSNHTKSTWQEIDPFAILRSYGFEVDESRQDVILADWEQQYGREWVLLALVEALHQGRYKLMSIGQILRCWERRGQPRLSFDREFQRMVLAEDWRPIVAPVFDGRHPELVEEPPLPQPRAERKLRALIGLQAV
jgi:hypothetical protein